MPTWSPASSRPSPHEYEHLQPGQVVFAFWALPAVRPAEDSWRCRRVRSPPSAWRRSRRTTARRRCSPRCRRSPAAWRPCWGPRCCSTRVGGKGILLGGAPGVPPAQFVVIGAGVLGAAAARGALGLGAQVTMLDQSVARLRAVSCLLDFRATTMLSTGPNLEKALAFADVVVAAAAAHGQRAPRAGEPRHAAADEAAQRADGPRHRHGRLLRDLAPDVVPRPDLRGRRHPALLRPQPALGRGALRRRWRSPTRCCRICCAVADEGIEPRCWRCADLRRGTYLYRGRCVRESLARSFGIPWEPLPGAGEART